MRARFLVQAARPPRPEPARRDGSGPVSEGGAVASSRVCKEVHEFHAIGKNPCYSSIPRRHTALQTAMSQKSLVDSTEKRATMQGSAEEKRCRSLVRSEEHTSELQSPCNLVCRLLLEKKKKTNYVIHIVYISISITYHM